jgi:hypothetical protein
MAIDIAWHEIQEQHDALAAKLTDPSLDSAKRRPLQKEMSRLAVLLTRHDEILGLEKKFKRPKFKRALILIRN